MSTVISFRWKHRCTHSSSSKCFSNPQSSFPLLVMSRAQRNEPRVSTIHFEPSHARCSCFISAPFGSFARSVPVSDALVHSLTLYALRRMALDGIRMPDGCYADGTWELKMHVTDLNRDVSLRVTGEIHVGGVMLKLVEKLGRRRTSIVNAFAKGCNRCLTQLYSLTPVHFRFF